MTESEALQKLTADHEDENHGYAAAFTWDDPIRTCKTAPTKA